MSDLLESESPAVDIEQLLCSVLACDRSYLFTWPDRVLSEPQLVRFEQLLKRRKDGEPIAHILGSRGFWSFDLLVNEHTLIPRPDTEVLVEWALELALPKAARVADLGTGTGAIALALAIEHPLWDVIATDRISEAVALACTNADRLEVNNISVLQGEWFDPLSGTFDLIVSNPPYIDPTDPHLTQGDLCYEPASALTALDSGMADLNDIIDHAPAFLNPGGWLLLEHGYDQAGEVLKRMKAVGFEQVKTRKDYGSNPRITGGCWRSSC